MNKAVLSLVVVGVSLVGCSNHRQIAPATGYSSYENGQSGVATTPAPGNSSTMRKNSYDNPHLDYSKGSSSHRSSKSREPYSFEKGYSK